MAVAFVHGEGVDGQPSRRQLVEAGNCEIAVCDKRQRPRNGRGAHDESVDALGLISQRRPLHDAEAVLLVDNDEPEIDRINVRRDQGVRSDDQHGLRRIGKRREDLFSLRSAGGAGQKHTSESEFFEKLPEIGIVLQSEYLRRRHERRGIARPHNGVRGGRGDYCLTGTHVADEYSVHGVISAHIAQDLSDGALLRRGERIGQ